MWTVQQTRLFSRQYKKLNDNGAAAVDEMAFAEVDVLQVAHRFAAAL